MVEPYQPSLLVVSHLCCVRRVRSIIMDWIEGWEKKWWEVKLEEHVKVPAIREGHWVEKDGQVSKALGDCFRVRIMNLMRSRYGWLCEIFSVILWLYGHRHREEGQSLLVLEFSEMIHWSVWWVLIKWFEHIRKGTLLKTVHGEMKEVRMWWM